MEPHKRRGEALDGRPAKAAANWLALGMGLAFVAAIVAFGLRPSGRPANTKVVIGTRDEIYYYHSATKEDAQSLGLALKSMGFFHDRGARVLFSKGTEGRVVSFYVNDGAWALPETISNFEEIGRRIAAPAGGFPIQVRLLDPAQVLRRQLTVGKVIVGARDEVYYFDAATREDAEALGHALKTAGFFADRGASVALAKGGGTTVSFVVDQTAWERPGAVAALERLVRQAAPSIGGLPVKLRLVNSQMEVQREVAVQ